MLGLWIEQTEGAKFWLSVMNELKARGVDDILIAVVGGLKAFPDAIGAVFPQATFQTCLVHLIRRSLAYVSYKERRALAGALKTIYRAPTESAAQDALEALEAGAWAQKYPAIIRARPTGGTGSRRGRMGCTGVRGQPLGRAKRCPHAPQPARTPQHAFGTRARARPHEPCRQGEDFLMSMRRNRYFRFRRSAPLGSYGALH